LFAWLAPRPGERILDLGCGDGVLSERIVGCGASVVGIDTATAMVDAARRRGIDARVLDVHDLDVEEGYDAVFSNAALHWMRAHREVFARVRRALRPGGRFVAEMGAQGNVAVLRSALHAVLARHGVDPRAHDPWTFAAADEQKERLETAGLRVERIEVVPRPTPLPTGLRGWLDTFGQSFLDALPAPLRPVAVAEVEDLAAPLLRDVDGLWVADYVRLRWIARRPR
jgi:SAM-dependent methyltransferase